MATSRHSFTPPANIPWHVDRTSSLCLDSARRPALSHESVWILGEIHSLFLKPPMDFFLPFATAIFGRAWQTSFKYQWFKWRIYIHLIQACWSKTRGNRTILLVAQPVISNSHSLNIVVSKWFYVLSRHFASRSVPHGSIMLYPPVSTWLFNSYSLDM